MSDENAGASLAQEVADSLQSLSVKSEPSDSVASDHDHIKKTEKHKVDILLKPTGNAPIMKKKNWTVDSDKPIGWVIEFMRKYLKLEQHEKLFLYINQTFAPSPDQLVKNLYDCYNTEGKLVLHYCKTQAWG